LLLFLPHNWGSAFQFNKEEWFCNCCGVSYYPNKGEKVKRANKPLISMVKEDIELSSTYGKPKLPRSFEERKRHGVKITSYTTTEEG
jgi:hypothetical protein